MTTLYAADALIAEIKTRLLALTFADTKKVFGPRSVVESAKPPTKAIDASRTPIAQINSNDVGDDDCPAIRYTTVTVTIYALDRRDELGEAATAGAADGKGLAQIVRLAELSLQSLGRAVVPIRSAQTASAKGEVRLDDGEMLAYRVLQFQATCSVETE